MSDHEKIVTPVNSDMLTYAYGQDLLTFLSRWGAENLDSDQSTVLNQGLEEISRVLVSAKTHMTEMVPHLDIARRYAIRWAHTGSPAHFRPSSAKHAPPPGEPEYIDIDSAHGVLMIPDEQ